MTKEKPLEIITKELNEMYFIVKELEKLEDNKNADYSGVIEELTWNRCILKDQLFKLRERNQLEKATGAKI